MADQPTSQGTKVGKTNVRMQGQYGSEFDAQAPSRNKPSEVRP
jgi:hypothetical protein